MFRIHSHYKENNNGISLINFYINTVGKNHFMGAFNFLGISWAIIRKDSMFSEFRMGPADTDCVILIAYIGGSHIRLYTLVLIEPH